MNIVLLLFACLGILHSIRTLIYVRDNSTENLSTDVTSDVLLLVLSVLVLTRSLTLIMNYLNL